ncbi:MAG: hypothetical protein JSS07_01490 [Proteobacteria bacterium]|nr:hypothetical protein [Pseudomonadota bacterium]
MLMRDIVNFLYRKRETITEVLEKDAQKVEEIAQQLAAEGKKLAEIGKQALTNTTEFTDNLAQEPGVAEDVTNVLTDAAKEEAARNAAEQEALGIKAGELLEKLNAMEAEAKRLAEEAAKALAVNMTDTVGLANHTALNTTVDMLNTTATNTTLDTLNTTATSAVNQTIVDEVCQAVSKLPCSDTDLTCRFNDFLDENFPGVELKGPINDITRTVGSELTGGKLDMSKFDISDYMNMTNTPAWAQEKLKSAADYLGMNSLTFGLIAGTAVSLIGLYSCMSWYNKQSKEVQSKIEKATFNIINGNTQLVALFNASVAVRKAFDKEVFSQSEKEEILAFAKKFTDNVKVKQFLQMDADLQNIEINSFKNTRAAAIEKAKSDVAAKAETVKVTEQSTKVEYKAMTDRELKELKILATLSNPTHKTFVKDNFALIGDAEVAKLETLSKFELVSLINKISVKEGYAIWKGLKPIARMAFIDSHVLRVAQAQASSASYTPLMQAQAQAKAQEKPSVEVKAEDQKKPSV